MPNALTISPLNTDYPEQLTFEQLRRLGIDHVASMSGDIWTDHNLHDPGITILEALCYVLTDLAYRNQLSIEDILTPNPREQRTEDNFFTPAEILTNNPLTILDYRKMLIDIDGVRNAWLEISEEQEAKLSYGFQKNSLKYGVESKDHELLLNGLYKVYIELENNISGNQSDTQCQDIFEKSGLVLEKVKKQLHAHRNLCEDFFDLCILRDEEIGLCTDIELEPNAVPEEVQIEIFEKIQRFLSPSLQFYTLSQLLKKGKTTDEIFAGRPHTMESHGFIDTKELESVELRKEIHTSDLYKEILKIEGVRAIRKLFLINFLNDEPQTSGEEWCLGLTEGYRPILSVPKSVVTFYKGQIPFRANEAEVTDAFNVRLSNFNKVLLEPYELDLSIPKGIYRNDLGGYYSVQHDLPEVYGIGEGGLAESESKIRKSQALQLKGYLLFFDQMLANYVGQLSHARDLFSMSNDENREEESRRTYFDQGLTSVPLMEHLVPFGKDRNGQANLVEGEIIAFHETSYASSIERDREISRLIELVKRQRQSPSTIRDGDCFRFTFLDDSGNILLKSKKKYETEKEALNVWNIIQFLGTLPQSYSKIDNQQQSIYTFSFIYQPIYYNEYLKSISESESAYFERREQFLDHLLARFGEDFSDYVVLMFALEGGRKDAQEIIKDKSNFLSDYPEISRNRGRAFNYIDQGEIWNSNNTSGLQKRVAGLMGIDNAMRRNLGNFQIKKEEACYCFQIKDHRGNVIFEEVNGHSSKDETQEAAFCEKIQTYGSQSENYRKIICGGDHVFGFELLDNDGCVFAHHPGTYATPEKCEDKINCLVHLFEAISPDWANTQGLTSSGFIFDDNITTGDQYFFQLTNPQGDQILFEDPTRHETEASAWEVFGLFLDAVTDFNNFIDSNDFVKNQFGFFIQNLSNGENIGNYFVTPGTVSVREEDKVKAYALLNEKTINYEIIQEDERYGWRLNDHSGNCIIMSFQKLSEDAAIDKKGSIVFFKSQKQALDAYLTFRDDLMAGDFIIHPSLDDSDKFYFYFKTEAQIVTARSNGFETADQRDQVLSEIDTIVAQIGDYSNALQLTSSYKFHFKTDTNILISDLLFRNEQTATLEWESIFVYAVDRSQYCIEKKDSYCEYRIRLRGKHKMFVASSGFDYISKAKAKKAINRLVKASRQKVVEMEIVASTPAYEFVFYDSDQTRVLESYQLYSEKADAMYYFLEMLQSSPIESFLLKKENQDDSKFWFVFKNKGDEILAKSSEIFVTASERDSKLNHTAQLFSNTPNDLDIFSQEGGYFFNLLDNNQQAILNGTIVYKIKEEAEQEFFTTLADAVTVENYQDIERDDSDLKSFGIKDDMGEITAQYFEFLLPEKFEQTKSDFLAYAGTIQCPVNLISTVQNTDYELWWESCNEYWEVLFTGDDMKEKIEAFRNEKVSEEEPSTTLVFTPMEDDDGFYFGINDDGLFMEHPVRYETEEERNCVMKDAEYYLCNGAWSLDCASKLAKDDCKNINEEGEEVPSSEEEKHTFQLCKEDNFFALHPKKYHSCEERNTALEELQLDAKKGIKHYTQILFGGPIFCLIDGLFYFQIKGVDKETFWWQSAKGYPSRQEAEAAFQKEFIEIIQYASDFEKYQFPDVDDCPDDLKITLLDSEGNTLAILPVAENEDWQQLAAERIEMANIFPFAIQGGKIIFRTFNDSENCIDWKSSTSFENFEDAISAFRYFCLLLTNPDNIVPTGSPDMGFFSIGLREILLESTKVWEGEEATWEAIRTPFLVYAGNEKNLQIVKDYNKDCGFSFCIVNDRFSLAWHPCDYATTLEREFARDELFAHANCEKIKCTDILHGTCCRNDVWHYLIKDEETQDVLWRSIESFPIQSLAKEACEEQHVRLLDYARSPENYRLKRIDSTGECMVQLQNPNGQIIAEMPVPFASFNARLVAIETQINFARQFPFYELNGAIGIQIFDPLFDKKRIEEKVKEYFEATSIYKNKLCSSLPDESETSEEEVAILEDCGCGEERTLPHTLNLTGEVVWVGTQTYTDIECAKIDLEKIKAKLKNKACYYRDNENECGPFSLHLVNEKAILAKHPIAYPSFKQLEKAIENTMNCLNAEGFHLVEHILLRPRFTKEELWVLKVDKEGIDVQIGCKRFVSQEQIEGSKFNDRDLNDGDKTYKECFLEDVQLSAKRLCEFYSIYEWSSSWSDYVNRNLALPYVHIYDFFRKLKSLNDITAETIIDDNELLDLIDQVNNIENIEIISTLFECFKKGEPDETLQMYLASLNNFDDLPNTNKIAVLENLKAVISYFHFAYACMFVEQAQTMFLQYEKGESIKLDLYLNGEQLTIGNKFYCKPTDANNGGELLNDLECLKNDLTIDNIECCNLMEETEQYDLIPNNCPDPIDEDINDIPCNLQFEDPDPLFSQYIPGADPYSFWITAVIPYWPKRFQNDNFRQFLEEVLRKETPAHIGLKICWINPQQMLEFEQRYRRWLEAMSGSGTCLLPTANNDLIEILFDEHIGLRNEYKPARLHDCENAGGEGDIVFLGQTKLG